MRDAPGDPVGEGHADAGKDRGVLALEDRVGAHCGIVTEATCPWKLTPHS